ncbi:unnamed protein product [Phytophthora fragariaefolia]|uniref:Unnamed protein product n=1 Tax=Phytophthora fragariaefolia TaxID=1490495 RepID=A0A9W6YBS8_9STRA|nr:unnamed protein product [Phytophthora fragariaefolia]
MGLRRSPRIGRTLSQQTEEADEKMMEDGTQLLGGREEYVRVEYQTDRAHAGNDDESTSTMRLSKPSGVNDEEGEAASVLENPGATEVLYVDDDDDEVSEVRGGRPVTPAVDASDVDVDDDVERVDDGAGRDESTAPGDNRIKKMAMALQQLTAMVNNLEEVVSLNRNEEQAQLQRTSSRASRGDRVERRVKPRRNDVQSEGSARSEMRRPPSRSRHRLRHLTRRRMERQRWRSPSPSDGSESSSSTSAYESRSGTSDDSESDDGGDEPSDDDASEEGDEPQVPR